MSISYELKSLSRGLVRNFLQMLRAIPPMRFDLTRIEASAAQLAVTIGFSLCVTFALQAWLSWPISAINQYAVLATMATEFGSLVALTLGALFVFRGDLAARLIIAVTLAALPGNVVIILFQSEYASAFSVGDVVLFAILATGLPILVVLRGLGTRSFPGALRGLPALTLVVGISAWVPYIMPYDNVFLSANYDTSEAGESYNQVNIENLYYAQPDLIAMQLNALRSQTPGKSDLYALLGAGYAYQSVFLSEVEKVSDLLADTHHTDGQTIILANSAPNPQRYPMLNRHNLSDALNAIGAAMDPAEDIALLFLTSHGAEDSLSLGFYEAGLDSLNASDLADLLDSSGIRNAVIVVSACRSGSFIDDLAGPTRMVITAAAADRSSFGCADKLEWTEFGRAFFNMALRDTRDFRVAFRTARQTVETWERDRGQTASQPQISVGKDFDAILDQYLAVEVTRKH